MTKGHLIEIRYPATAIDSLQARRAVNDLMREAGNPEFFANPTEYEPHQDWGERFICRDCGEEFETREQAREHTRKTWEENNG